MGDYRDSAQEVCVCTPKQHMGTCAITPPLGTSRPAPGHKIYPYLLRHLRVTQANCIWELDTTYIPMERGFVYLMAAVDVTRRQVFDHKVATTLEACHAAKDHSQALGRYGKPEIVNTDQPPVLASIYILLPNI